MLDSWTFLQQRLKHTRAFEAANLHFVTGYQGQNSRKTITFLDMLVWVCFETDKFLEVPEHFS